MKKPLSLIHILAQYKLYLKIFLIDREETSDKNPPSQIKIALSLFLYYTVKDGNSLTNMGGL